MIVHTKERILQGLACASPELVTDCLRALSARGKRLRRDGFSSSDGAYIMARANLGRTLTYREAARVKSLLERYAEELARIANAEEAR